MDILPGLLYYLLASIVALAIFIIIRQFMLWYWRVNEIADNLAYIADHYRRIDQEAGRRRIEETRNTSGAGSPFSGLGQPPRSHRASTTSAAPKWPEG